VNGSTQYSLAHSQSNSMPSQLSGHGTQKYSVMNATSATQPSSGPHSEQSATIVPVSPDSLAELELEPASLVCVSSSLPFDSLAVVEPPSSSLV
jgi:hypothetical protein